jgi:hypothetical protein
MYAVRDPYHLHGVHPFNRLMDEQGNITPLYVSCSLRRSYRSHGQISLMSDLGAINTLVVGMDELLPMAEPSVQTPQTQWTKLCSASHTGDHRFDSSSLPAEGRLCR